MDEKILYMMPDGSDFHFNEIKDENRVVYISWSKKEIYKSYEKMFYDFYKCGECLLNEICLEDEDYEKTDMWFLATLYLVRHSFELALKSLLLKEFNGKKDIIKTHDISSLFREYTKFEKIPLNKVEIDWLVKYFKSIASIDLNSDNFRFEFSGEFVTRFSRQLLDKELITYNCEQAFYLLDKCIKKDINLNEENLNLNEDSDFIIDNGNYYDCLIDQKPYNRGFYEKIKGYIGASDFLYNCQDIDDNTKFFPIIFLCRNVIELTLKYIYFLPLTGITKELSEKYHNHIIYKKLWNNIKDVIYDYSRKTNQNLEVLKGVEIILIELEALDKEGLKFRYPTDCSLNYYYNQKKFDIKHIYEHLRMLINALVGIDSILEMASEYEMDLNR